MVNLAKKYRYVLCFAVRNDIEIGERDRACRVKGRLKDCRRRKRENLKGGLHCVLVQRNEIDCDER